MRALWVKIGNLKKHVSVGFVCSVLFLSAGFTALPKGIFADLIRVDWYWGIPESVYAVEHSIDGDWSGFDRNGLFFDLLFWPVFFPLTAFALTAILRKFKIRIRPVYSLCIIGILTGALYAVVFRPDALINVETGGYLSCFESRSEQIEEAMRWGDVETLSTLFKNNPALVFNKDIVGQTPLHKAAYYGQRGIVKLLLDHNADVHVKDMYGETPLFDSAMNGYLGATELLLKNGSEVNIKNDNQQTPLFRAVEGRGNTGIVELLLASNANVNAVCEEEYTPLHEAAWQGSDYVVQLLIASGAKINATNQQGETPLHDAVYRGSKDIVKLLLVNKANVNAKDRNGTTPIHIALGTSNDDVVELLRQYGGTNN